MVAEATCYMHLNDTKRALPLFVRALEVIDVDEAELWARARKDLYSIIQITETESPRQSAPEMSSP